MTHQLGLGPLLLLECRVVEERPEGIEGDHEGGCMWFGEGPGSLHQSQPGSFISLEMSTGRSACTHVWAMIQQDKT